MCALCSWSQVSAFQHYRDLPLASSLSQSLYSSPKPYPPFGSNPSYIPPTTLGPRLPPPLCPLHSGPGLLGPSTPPAALPVDHTFRFGSPTIAYTGLLLSFAVRPSSVLLTSVGPGFVIPSAFYTPPALYYPLPPLYIAHNTPPTLPHWWFGTWGAQPPRPLLRDLHLPRTNSSICVYQNPIPRTYHKLIHHIYDATLLDLLSPVTESATWG